MRFLILLLLTFVAFIAACGMIIGLAIGMIPLATFATHHGEELVKFQLSGVALAVVSFVVLTLMAMIIARCED